MGILGCVADEWRGLAGLDDEAVVEDADVRGECGFDVGVFHVVGEVCEEGAFGLELCDDGEGLFEG